MSYDRDALLELIRTESLQRGEFTLASGKKASYYLDCRNITLHPKGANVIAEGMLDVMRSTGTLPEAVGGMAIGADPITASIITLAGQQDLPLKGFMVRKEPKDHGTGKQVEGPVKAGQRVVIVEDVITSGGSALKAVDAAREYGLVVEKVILSAATAPDACHNRSSSPIFARSAALSHSCCCRGCRRRSSITSPCAPSRIVMGVYEGL